jgi:acyl-CoA-binding protein
MRIPKRAANVTIDMLSAQNISLFNTLVCTQFDAWRLLKGKTKEIISVQIPDIFEV